MNSNAIAEYINKKAVALWLWFTTFSAYAISTILPIIGANAEKWLKPFLDRVNAPDFLKSDFTVYASVFGVCGYITTKAIKVLINAEDRYKSEDAVKIRDLKRVIREQKDEIKKLKAKALESSAAHEAEIKKKYEEWNEKKDDKISLVKQANSDVLKRTIDEYEREIRRMAEYIKLQEAAVDAMKNYGSARQDMQEYNSYGSRRKYNPAD